MGLLGPGGNAARNRSKPENRLRYQLGPGEGLARRYSHFEVRPISGGRSAETNRGTSSSFVGAGFYFSTVRSLQ